MKHRLSISSTTLFLLLTVSAIISCRNNNGEGEATYKSQQFDHQVIDKLPVYDSLAVSILAQMALFQQSRNLNESYQAYRYFPASTENDVYKVLPPHAGSKIDYYYNKLGKDFIYGFDVFKDSSLKIYVRNYLSPIEGMDIEENLSYYPTENKMKKRTFPDKDTALTKHWQYWIRVNKPRLF